MADVPIICTGVVQGGQLQIRRRAQMVTQLARMRDGTEVRIVIERRRATRSLAQNAWYHSQIVGSVAAYTGHDPDEIHDIFKHLFLKKHVLLGAQRMVTARSTTQLNKLQFGEYCEQCRKWAAETLGLNIPDPDPEDR